MSRRSARLVSGGYYQSDDDSDSSSVTNISYRESPVRVFKKKAVNRKASTQPNSRASSHASSTSAAPVTAEQYNVDDDITSCLTPALQNSETQHTMRTVPYSATTATPRPALTPAPTRSKTPTRCPSVPPEQSHAAGLYRQHRPHHLEPNQSNIDSSGYSSSEGHYRRATANSISSDVPITGRKSSSSSQTSSLSLVIAAAQSRIMLLTDLANTSLTTGMKKAIGLLLFLLITILSIWFLLPLLTSLIYRTTITTTPIPTTTKSQPVPPAIPPPPQPNAMHPAPVVDPAIVSAVVEEKMQRLLGEVLLKQDTLYSQMEERVQMEVQAMRAKLEAVTDSRLRLGKEAAGLSRQVADYLTASRSDAASLILRIQALEAKNAKLSQELSSIQMTPPPAPCPDPSTASPHNQLTPELQQALERWLTDHIKQEQQDRSRLGGTESCSDCGRPMADNMADFALESQGASVISTRCSETYRTRSACVTLFGFPLWYPSESPRTVIQGFPVLLPGKCWAFHGVQGTLVLSLSHPIRITHVTLDHLRRSNAPTGRIDSAPKDFEVYGMMEDTEEGSLLGRFTYDQDGESTQTFQLPSPSDAVHRFVELRILSNWGLVEYTCVYRFRVHGKIAST